MTIIKINNADVGDITNDSVKYNKDCRHFKSLKDGSIIGDYHYWNLSLKCRQVDVLLNGKVLPMEACWLPIYDGLGNKVAEELFCTGMHDLRPLKERIEDNKVT